MKKKLFVAFIVAMAAACQGQQPNLQPSYSPIPIEKHWPKYPDILKRVDIDGTVELSVLVDENGVVSALHVFKSIPIVDSVSIEAARKWKFKPGTIADANGKQVASKFWFPISFDWSGIGQQR
ncbi:MAG TPA: energy transducer TonB [Bacteroidota bacterium]